MRLCECGCGTWTPEKDQYGNPRKYVPGHGITHRHRNAKRRVREVTVMLASEEEQMIRAKAPNMPLGRALRELALR